MILSNTNQDMFLESFLSHSVMNAFCIMRYCCSKSLLNMKRKGHVALSDLAVTDEVYLAHLFSVSCLHEVTN